MVFLAFCVLYHNNINTYDIQAVLFFVRRQAFLIMYIHMYEEGNVLFLRKIRRCARF